MESMGEKGLYVETRLTIRHAGTQVVGDRASTADAESERYVEVLLRELRATASSVEADSPLHPSNIRVCLLSMPTSNGQ
jgi:hypothetical protein